MESINIGTLQKICGWTDSLTSLSFFLSLEGIHEIDYCISYDIEELWITEIKSFFVSVPVFEVLADVVPWFYLLFPYSTSFWSPCWCCSIVLPIVYTPEYVKDDTKKTERFLAVFFFFFFSRARRTGRAWLRRPGASESNRWREDGRAGRYNDSSWRATTTSDKRCSSCRYHIVLRGWSFVFCLLVSFACLSCPSLVS